MTDADFTHDSSIDTETAADTATDTGISRTDPDDIVWFAKGKHTRWHVGPFETPDEAIDAARGRRATANEPTETYHRQRENLNEAQRNVLASNAELPEFEDGVGGDTDA